MITICKDLMFAAWLSLLFTVIPTHCDEQHLDLASRSNFTQDSNTAAAFNRPLGSDRIKPLTPGQRIPPAVQPGQRKSPLVTLPLNKQTKEEHAEEKISGNLASLHDTSIMEVEAESPKNAKANLVETRSNSSSSTLSSSLESGIIPNTPFLAKLHHDEDSVESDSNSDDNIPHEHDNDDNFAEESSVHEHVEKYQLHQSSEDDDEIPPNTHLIQQQPVPAAATATSDAGASLPQDNKNPKFRGSVVVSSASYPVRIGPSTRVSSGSGIPANGGIGIQKPLPVVRREEAILIEESLADANAESLF